MSALALQEGAFRLRRPLFRSGGHEELQFGSRPPGAFSSRALTKNFWGETKDRGGKAGSLTKRRWRASEKTGHGEALPKEGAYERGKGPERKKTLVLWGDSAVENG